jgi:hypothetical protein
VIFRRLADGRVASVLLAESTWERLGQVAEANGSRALNKVEHAD